MQKIKKRDWKRISGSESNRELGNKHMYQVACKVPLNFLVLSGVDTRKNLWPSLIGRF